MINIIKLYINKEKYQKYFESTLMTNNDFRIENLDEK